MNKRQGFIIISLHHAPNTHDTRWKKKNAGKWIQKTTIREREIGGEREREKGSEQKKGKEKKKESQKSKSEVCVWLNELICKHQSKGAVKV